MGTTETSLTPLPIVDVHVVLRTPDGKILLSQRGGPYGYGQWHAPSGKLDPGEKPTHGAARELQEETGIYCMRIPVLLDELFPRQVAVSLPPLGKAPGVGVGGAARAPRLLLCAVPPEALAHLG
ncbi:NUDIX domain-containing protein [Kitasatospora xanthocidica]|uniref:NUDIX domain-containing protein n=1 Tax=Kitasatospora xanthocidica TaxID=83382 RepID=A0A372ZPC7_9ACTN|nr:NUDIX domain-containing protein [Kitasatospora xanthocidica]RGD57758.1 NUDIX domain-containing protein [Kitasatospora xanthocidica]